MSESQLDSFLKTYPHSRYYPELRLLTWHPQGVFDDDLADEVVGMLESEEKHAEVPFHRFVDLTGLTKISLKVGHVFQLAERRRNVPEPVRSAFYSDTVVGFGVARMYEMLMQGATIHVRAFRDRDEAAEWIGVPLPIVQR